MPISLRIPREKEDLISRAARRAGKTKTAFILDALDEKLGLIEDRGQTIRSLAGWLGEEEASELKANLAVFEEIREEDWG